MLYEVITRAVLGLPIPEITFERAGASAVILADFEGDKFQYRGVEKAASYPKSYLRIFGKPLAREYRRMGVALAYDELGADVMQVVDKAKQIAKEITVVKQ